MNFKLKIRKKKISLLNIVSLFLLSGALLLWFIAPGFALGITSTTTPSTASTTTSTPTSTPGTSTSDSSTSDSTATDENNVCLVQIMPQALAYYADVTSFISNHYLSEESASSLLDTALAKFKEFQTNMYELVATYGVADPGQPLAQEQDEISKCRDFVNLKIRTVEQMLRNHHLANASRKTTYTLVEKMKTLNEGLRDLNKNFARVYALFTTLSNKLTSVSK